MKVKEIVKRYRLSSNADVFVQHVKTGDLIELKESQLRDLKPNFVMEMRINSFDVTDNVLTIYAE